MFWKTKPLQLRHQLRYQGLNNNVEYNDENSNHLSHILILFSRGCLRWIQNVKNNCKELELPNVPALNISVSRGSELRKLKDDYNGIGQSREYIYAAASYTSLRVSMTQIQMPWYGCI